MSRSRSRSGLARGTVAGLTSILLAGACVATEEGGAQRDAGPVETVEPIEGVTLAAFDGCDPLADHLSERLSDHVGAYGFDGASAAGSATRFEEVGGAVTEADMAPSAAGGDARSGEAPATTVPSTGTNVQVAGVDEPDLVKVAGNTMVVLTGGELVTVDVGADEPEVLGRLELGGGAEQLLVSDDRALVISPGASLPIEPLGALRGAAEDLVAPTGGSTLIIVDLSDPGAPAVVSSTVVEGNVVDARLVDDTARVAVSGGVPDLGWVQPASPRGEDTALETNRRIAAEADGADWLPGAVTVDADGDVDQTELTTCEQVRVAPDTEASGTLSIVTAQLDEATIDPGRTVTVVGAGQDVYATAERFYVATGTSDRSGTNTAVHAFDTSATDAAPGYLGSAEVEGWLLNQFAMSEHDGHLRVATTLDGRGGAASGPDTESQVTVLSVGPDGLAEVGRVDDLGRGEEIHAVRFLGDQGYVVTFRRTDPLYAIDLSDPTSPQVTGELKITGYSAYLHPVGDGRLLGVGQDATLEGRTTGTQVSLFDVSDPTAPSVLDQWSMPDGTSDVEWEHHAFTWLSEESLAVLPVQAYGAEPFVGAVGLEVGDASLAERGRISHQGAILPGPDPLPGPVPPPSTTIAPCDPNGQCPDDELIEPIEPIAPPIVEGSPILRSLVVDGELLTISQEGLLVSDLASFEPRSWLAW